MVSQKRGGELLWEGRACKRNHMMLNLVRGRGPRLPVSFVAGGAPAGVGLVRGGAETTHGPTAHNTKTRRLVALYNVMFLRCECLSDDASATHQNANATKTLSIHSLPL